MKSIFLLALPALLTPAARAQDIAPALDPTEIAGGQVTSGMMRGHAERDRKARLAGKRPTNKPLTPAEQRRAHRLEVEAVMRRPPVAPGSTR